jgi:hypothetical protein
VKHKLKHILKSHGHEFIKTYGSELPSHVISVLLSVMFCGTLKNGYRSFFCPDCGHIKRIPFSCKSRLCPSCSQWSSDRFAINFVQRMLPYTHRHLVMSLPEMLWGIFHDNPSYQKELIRCAYQTVRQVMCMYLHADVMPGSMCVLHNFGRDLKKNCHVHMIVSEGGMCDGRWYKFTYFPFVKQRNIRVTLNEVWRDNVLELLRLSLPRTVNNERFLSGIRNRYPNGFYVFGDTSCRIKCNRSAYRKSKYITRYVRHPPISDNRISDYDGKTVKIWYDHPSSGVRCFVSYPVLEFIYRVVIHVPARGMHVVVSFGLYSPRYVSVCVVQSLFDNEGSVLDPKKLSWRMSLILQTGVDPLCCPFCGGEMYDVSVVYKIGNKLKVKYRFDVYDMEALGYSGECLI